MKYFFIFIFCCSFTLLHAQVTDSVAAQGSGLNNIPPPKIGFPIPTVITGELFDAMQLEYRDSKLICLNDSSEGSECFTSFPRFRRIPRGCVKPALESKDKDFIAFFNNLRPKPVQASDFIGIDDINAVYPYMSTLRCDLAISFDKELDEISVDQIEQNIQYQPAGYARRFNADIVITYPISLGNEFFRGKYNHCHVLLLYKREVGYFSLYCFYTDKGYKKKKKYDNELEKMVKFKCN